MGKIQLTEAEKGIDLADSIQRAESLLRLRPLDVVLNATRCVLRIGLYHSQTAAGLRAELADREQLIRQLKADLHFVKGERDKLAAEIEEWEFATPTQFETALAELAEYHTEEGGESYEAERDIARKHGIKAHDLPILRLENLLLDPDPPLYEVAKEAVKALAHYLESEREASEDAEASVSEAEPEMTDARD